MIVKVKTFSGETLYLPEEDYLEEVMYSDSTNETKKSSGIGGATVVQVLDSLLVPPQDWDWYPRVKNLDKLSHS